jgi:Protein of unknown function (DUF3592)
MLIFIGLLFFLIGLAVLVSGLFAVFKVRGQIANSVKATGTVIAFGTIAGKSGYLYCPQVVFPIPGGRTIKFQSQTGTQPPSYNVGQKVQVVYEINNPQKAEIDSLMALWFAPGCMSLMGLLFSTLGLMLFGIGILVGFKT